MARIVLFGATGYTGRLAAEAMVERGLKPVLAARSQDKLEALADELGGDLETATADVADPPSVRALVVSEQNFRRLLDQSPAVQIKVLEALAERVAATSL